MVSKKINHGKSIGNTVAGDSHKTYGTHQNTTICAGYLDTAGSFTGDRRTQVTLMVNIMTHTTFTQSNLSISSACVNPSFSIMSKRSGEYFAFSASAKQKPVHC